jgi:hypothetical protein
MGFASTLDPEVGPHRRLAGGDVAGIGYERGRKGRLRMLSEAFEARLGGQIESPGTLLVSGSNDALMGR